MQDVFPGYKAGEYAFLLLYNPVLKVMTIRKASLVGEHGEAGAVVCLQTSSLRRNSAPWCVVLASALPPGPVVFMPKNRFKTPLTRRRKVGQGQVVPSRKFAQKDGAF